LVYQLDQGFKRLLSTSPRSLAKPWTRYERKKLDRCTRTATNRC
jgi:hypothetical protein